MQAGWLAAQIGAGIMANHIAIVNRIKVFQFAVLLSGWLHRRRGPEVLEDRPHETDSVDCKIHSPW